MMFLSNDLKRVDWLCNKNGSLLTNDNFDIFFNSPSQGIVKFPQKEDCILNLNSQTWLTNSITGSNFGLSQDFDFDFFTGNDKRSTFGDILNSLDPNYSFLRTNTQFGFWEIGRTYNNNKIALKNNRKFINENGSFTIAMVWKAFSYKDWKDLWFFNDSGELRLEYGNNGLNIYTTATLSQPIFVPLPSDDRWHFAYFSLQSDNTGTLAVDDLEPISATFGSKFNPNSTLTINAGRRSGHLAHHIWLKMITAWNGYVPLEQVKPICKMEIEQGV